MLIRSRRTSDKKKIRLLLIVVVGLLLVAVVLPATVRMVSGVVLFPIIQVERWFAESNQVLPALWRDKIAMQNQINTLKQELVLSGKKSLTQQQLAEENNRLRLLLGAENELRLLAAVVGKPGNLPYDLIQIDRGTQTGVLAGAPVFVGRDTVIGVVSAVQSNTSFVTLFTTPNFRASVYLSGANVTAELEGLGGGVARVKVPQGILLRTGDLVHLPGVQPGVYGRIAWVESEPTQPEQFGYITPEVPISSLFQVSVGSPTDISSDPEVAQQYMLDIQADLLFIPEILPATTTATTTDTVSTDNVSEVPVLESDAQQVPETEPAT